MDLNRKKTYLLVILLALVTGFGCGRSSGTTEEGTTTPAETPVTAPIITLDVRGSVKSVTGSQSDMSSWIIAFVERDSGLAKVAAIDAAGNYTITGLIVNYPQTIVLLDPQFRFSSVLSAVGTAAGNIQQYFTLDSAVVPTVVHNGPTLRFADTSSVTFSGNIAADTDFDGIPNGMEAATSLVDLSEFSLDSFSLTEEIVTTGIDTDADGIYNEYDTDIDGDGDTDVISTGQSNDKIAWHENLTLVSAKQVNKLKAFAQSINRSVDQ